MRSLCITPAPLSIPTAPSATYRPNEPAWLEVISHLNPLTYVVDALRTFMLASSASSFGLGLDYAVILVTTIVLVLIGARLYPQLGV